MLDHRPIHTVRECILPFVIARYEQKCFEQI